MFTKLSTEALDNGFVKGLACGQRIRCASTLAVATPGRVRSRPHRTARPRGLTAYFLGRYVYRHRDQGVSRLLPALSTTDPQSCPAPMWKVDPLAALKVAPSSPPRCPFIKHNNAFPFRSMGWQLFSTAFHSRSTTLSRRSVESHAGNARWRPSKRQILSIPRAFPVLHKKQATARQSFRINGLSRFSEGFPQVLHNAVPRQCGKPQTAAPDAACRAGRERVRVAPAIFRASPLRTRNQRAHQRLPRSLSS